MARRAIPLGTFLFLSVFVIGLCAEAQSPPEGAKKPDYSQEPFVIEQLLTRISFENDGTGTRETTVRVRIQSEASLRQFGLLVFPYLKANENVEVAYARVHKPDGTVIQTPPENVLDMASEITREAPFYSDLYEKHVAVKALRTGDVLEYQVRSRLTTPLVPGQFWFNDSFFKDGIALQEELQVTVPRDRYVNAKSPEVQPTVKEEGNRRIYTWKTANLERKTRDEKSKTRASREGPLPSVQMTSFKNWEEVGRWFGALLRERVSPTQEIRAKAAEVTKGLATDSEKLHAIYNYVATKFRYIGVAFGIGRYQPHAAADVLSNEYGDCKDKHTLLASLLEAAGLKAYPALINSSRKIDPDAPSPGQFEHLISVVPLGNDFVWLDTTTEVAPFGFLTFNLRDKQALMIPEDGPALLVKTPAEPPFPNFVHFDIDGRLSAAGTLEAKVERSARGDAEVLFRSAFRRTPQTQWKDLGQAISYASGFGGDVSEVTPSSPEATAGPFRFTYHYVRENYSDWANHRITPPFPPMMLAALDKEDTSAEPVELGAPGEIICKASIELPRGYTPRLPPPVDIKQDFAEYRSTYSVADGILRAERHLIIKAREVPSARKEEYRTFQRGVSDDENYYITLESGTGTFFGTTGNAEAEKLFNEGRQALQRQDVRAAIDIFKRAAALDPKYSAPWIGIAMAQMSTGQVDQGLEAFRKAIELDPKQPAAYKLLATALMSMQRREEAVRVWEDLLKVNPQDRDAAANLGSLLLNLKRDAEAAAALESAVKLNPDDSLLQVRLGHAYLGAGDANKAMVAYQKAAELDPTPSMWNAISYNLAEANQKLPEALRYAEMAVQARENETAKIRLDKLEVADLKSMRDLAAEWDTLGWVHFRLGNLDKAEKYLYASWVLSQDPVVGDHVGQLYEKQQRKNAAIHVYALTMAVRSNMPENRERLLRLLGSAFKVDAAIENARPELAQMRTIKLSGLAPKQATGEFFVVFTKGPKVEDVKFIKGAEQLRQATQSLVSAKYELSFPDDGPTRLVRRGILVCSSVAERCDFVLLTPDMVRSVN